MLNLAQFEIGCQVNRVRNHMLEAMKAKVGLSRGVAHKPSATFTFLRAKVECDPHQPRKNHSALLINASVLKGVHTPVGRTMGASTVLKNGPKPKGSLLMKMAKYCLQRFI